MNVLLSIKPEFAEKVLTQQKQYEFRKTSFRDPGAIDTIFMYASSPTQEVVGQFSIGEIVEATPMQLWDDYAELSGIQHRDRFMSYFDGTETGYAIEIKDPTSLSPTVDPWSHFDDFRPPVSFQYVDETLDLAASDSIAAD